MPEFVCCFSVFCVDVFRTVCVCLFVLWFCKCGPVLLFVVTCFVIVFDCGSPGVFCVCPVFVCVVLCVIELFLLSLIVFVGFCLFVLCRAVLFVFVCDDVGVCVVFVCCVCPLAIFVCLVFVFVLRIVVLLFVSVIVV